jgi:ketosteroid isomerase-like protein
MVTQAEAGARAALDELTAAQNAGDADRMRAVLSPRADTIHIGTDPEEWLTSSQWAELVEQGVEPSGVSLVIDDATVHPEGDDVAWVAGRGRFRAADGRERAIRLSAVLVREAGRWSVVHVHGSAGVPNDDLFS